MRSAAAALVTLLLALPARAEDPGRIAFLGLRPAESEAFAGTALQQLPEAQRLRTFAENAVETISGATMLRHAELRVSLAPGYLVDLFECAGEAACQLRVAAPLERLGVPAAIVGDLFASGEGYRVRLRRLDLRRGRVAAETTFTLPRDEARSLDAWRGALKPLLEDAATIRIVTNVSEPACTVDGVPCQRTPAGLVARLSPGEHVVELSKEGWKRAQRVVAVEAREDRQIALPLEELPVQAQKAPDPNARLPSFEAPGPTTKIAPWGLLRLAIGWDNVNAGYREDAAAVPRVDGVERGGFTVLPRPAIVGLTVQAPRTEGGWQLRGALSSGWVKDDGPEIDSAFAEVVKEEAGFRLMLGWGQSIVSSLTAGTLTLPEGFGDLAPGLVGVTVSKSVGPFLLEGFVGRQKTQFSAQSEPASSTPHPFVAAHVAFVSAHVRGRLYGDEYPLTIGVSAITGAERVGLADEQTWAAARGFAPPRREDVPSTAVSLEAYIPFGLHGGFAGEAYLGEDVRLFEGALWQVPRVDPATGAHTALRSTGGWGQVSVNLGEKVELRMVAGVDRIVRGLGAGLAFDDSHAIRGNRLFALNAVWYAIDHLVVGVQVHTIRTEYLESSLGDQRLVGVVATSQLKF